MAKSNRETEYMDNCKNLLHNHNVKIQYANSKEGNAIAERDHKEFEKHSYIQQDAKDFLLFYQNVLKIGLEAFMLMMIYLIIPLLD